MDKYRISGWKGMIYMYQAKVKKLNPHIEEEVTLEIQGYQFTGFSTVCPYFIEEGKEYPVMISFTILDKLDLRKADIQTKGLQRLGDHYNYLIRGILHEDHIDIGIKIVDEDGYFHDYQFLAGNLVEMLVDRIAVEFL